MKIVIVPPALAELREASAFYAERANSELGLAFVAEFERVVSVILENPAHGHVFRPGRRRYLFRRFPYSVIYQVTAEEIRIIALAHQRQRPGYWRGRK